MSANLEWLKHLQDALEAVSGMKINERLRATLKRALSESIVQVEDDIAAKYVRRNAGEKWTDDLKELEAFLKKAKDCMSWGEQRVILEELAQKFGRPEKTMKRKAVEMGYGKKVDYWMNNPHG